MLVRNKDGSTVEVFYDPKLEMWIEKDPPEKKFDKEEEKPRKEAKD